VPHAIIDSHCHLDVSEFAADRLAVLDRARAAGVAGVIIPAIDLDGIAALVALCQQHDDLWPALGLHPIYSDRHPANAIQQLADWVERARPVAIGEVGLDYFIPDADRPAQQRLFNDQIHLASQFHLPLLLHIRKAHDDVIATLRRHRFSGGGIAHAFNGSLDQARRLIDLGFLIGVGGTVTYANAHRIHRTLAALPLSALVLETDAPDIAPSAHRHQRNSPEYLPEILAALAELRQLTPAEVAAATTANLRPLLSLQAA
jgi:TatD DNase family protein